MSSDEDSDTPCSSFFSKRAQFAPRKTLEELKVAEELIKKIEEEKNSQIDEAKPFCNKAEPFGNKAECTKNKAKSTCKKGQKKKMSFQTAGKSQSGACSNLESSQPYKRFASSSVASTSVASTSVASPSSSSVIDDLEREISQTPLSLAAKKRLKKLRDDQELELMLIDAKNAMILEEHPFRRPENYEDLPTIEEEKMFHVTVSYMNKVARFKCLENQKFFKVFQDVADFFCLTSTEILLCLKDRNISVTDTPKSLGLSERDILECIPYKPDVPSGSTSNDDALIITFQSNDSISKIDIVANRMQKMMDIMEEYAEKRKMPLNEFTFEFDGIKLTGDETPAALDMETGDCVDVRVFMPLPQCSRTSDDKPGDIMLDDDNPSSTKDYFGIYFEDYTFPDSDSNGSDVVVLD